MTAEVLLARLERVRRTGDGRWTARCPAHRDKHPSLGVREMPDGTVLLRCHARQCDAAAIVAAVGLELHDLFPSRLPDGEHRRRPERKPWHAGEILSAIAGEATYVGIVACDLARGGEITDATRRRLLTAAGRLTEAAELARGR